MVTVFAIPDIQQLLGKHFVRSVAAQLHAHVDGKVQHLELIP